MPARASVSPRTIERYEFESRVLELRRKGLSYPKIASELGITAGEARKVVERALRRVAREHAEALRQLELQRLDALLAAYWDSALEGNYGAAYFVLRVMDQRAKLLGLYAPQSVSEDLGRAVLELLRRLPVPTEDAVNGEYHVEDERVEGLAAPAATDTE